jgi:hypothetical protein
MDIKKLKEEKFEIDERENYIIQDLECCLNCSYHETYAGLGCRLYRLHRFGEAYLPHEVNPLGKCDKYFDERKY